jgi:multidrug/hemolysin transport system permease protein
MRLVGVVVRRNLRAFVRDPLVVFFTFLAPVIFIFLFIVFYRRMVGTMLADSFRSTPYEDLIGLCDAWLFASAVLLATYTSTLGMLNAFIMDKDTGRFSDYLVSPVRRWQLTIGYILSTWLVAAVISTALMLLAPVWALVNGQAIMAPLDILKAIGAILLSTLVFATLNTLIATFIRSWNAFGGFSIVMGTSIGFLGFCYVPPAILTRAVNSTLAVLPFAQSASLIRDAIMGPSIMRVMDSVAEESVEGAIAGVSKALAVRLVIGEWVMPVLLVIGILLALAVILTILSTWRMNHVIK